MRAAPLAAREDSVKRDVHAMLNGAHDDGFLAKRRKRRVRHDGNEPGELGADHRQQGLAGQREPAGDHRQLRIDNADSRGDPAGNAERQFLGDRNALRIATENADALKLKNQCQILPIDALHPPRATAKCRLVFMSPPYRKGLIAPGLAALDNAGWIAPNALIIAETARKEPLELPDNFTPLFSRFYADTALHFVVSAPIK